MTASQAIKALGAEALALHEAKKPRYHLKTGGQYLHWSGTKLTANRDHAWLGTIEKARACRRVFAAAADCKAHRIGSVPSVNEVFA